MDSLDDRLSDEILTDEALKLMKKKLPSYVVNSLIATGYDTLDVIAELTDESISEIERIITNDFIGDDRFINQATGNRADASQFKFQPGHQKRIKKFIEEAKCLVKQKANECLRNKGQKRKAQQVVCPRSKLAKTDEKTEAKTEEHSGQARETTDDDKCGDKSSAVCTELDVLTEFRQNFAKWQRQQKEKRYREIKENKDFSLKINISADHSITAKLHCLMCCKSLSLGVKSNSILLSNWTRHINTCKGGRNPSTGKLTTLETFKFFSYKTAGTSSNNIAKPNSKHYSMSIGQIFYCIFVI